LVIPPPVDAADGGGDFVLLQKRTALYDKA
jgi:hypothetical protein